MQQDNSRTRVIQSPVAGKKRKVVARRNPSPENQTTEKASETSSDDGTPPVESSIYIFGVHFRPKAHSETSGSTEANQQRHKLRKLFASIREHRSRGSNAGK